VQNPLAFASIPAFSIPRRGWNTLCEQAEEARQDSGVSMAEGLLWSERMC